MVGARRAMLAALLAATAGCTEVTPAEGAWVFRQDGRDARLVYVRAGLEGPEFNCREGSEHVELKVAAPGHPPGEDVRLSLSAGERVNYQTDHRVDVTLPFHRWGDDPRFEASFDIDERMLSAFFSSRRLQVGDYRILPAGERRGPRWLADQEAVWRFEATCRSASRLSVVQGDPRPASLYAQLIALDPARAAEDARRALSRGDRRLAAVTGYSLVTPGVPGGRGGAEVRIVEPSGCVSGSQEHSRLRRNARAYAEAYNAVMLTALGEA